MHIFHRNVNILFAKGNFSRVPLFKENNTKLFFKDPEILPSVSKIMFPTPLFCFPKVR